MKMDRQDIQEAVRCHGQIIVVIRDQGTEKKEGIEVRGPDNYLLYHGIRIDWDYKMNVLA